MADNQDEVVYQFTGDVSSLRQATESALGLLNKYQTQIDRISADGGFGKSVKAAKSFQSQMTSATKQISNMQKQMKSVSDVKLFPSANVTQQLQGSLNSIGSVFGKLASSSKLSTKEVQSLTSQLRTANQGLKSNSAEVSALIQRETKWQATLDNVRNKTTQFRDTLDNLRGRISSVFDPLMSKLSSLNAPFVKLQAKLQSFKDKAAESFGRVSQLATTVVSALRRVRTAESDAADATNKSATAHSRLRNVLESIRNAFKKETVVVDKERDSLKTKNETLADSTRRHSSLRSILLALGRVFSSESTSIKAFNTNLKGLNSTSKLAKNVLSGLISLPISQWLTEAAKQSINYAENVNLFTVAMGDSLDVGAEFINQMSEIYGMDPSNLMRYAGNFYQLADAISMPDASAAKLSLSLVKATNDISSLFNVPIEDVFEDLSSGMQGMSRAVRKYGMDIRTTTLQQTALTLGITENVESMSEANRQGLRFITMMQQASNASGDFARTIESPANQLKIFKEQIAQLGRAIGDLFITPLASALQYINGFVMALRTAISFIGSVLGMTDQVSTDSVEDMASSVDDIGSAAKNTAKELKKMIAPFDELNVLQQTDTSGNALGDIGNLDPAIEDAIANMSWGLDDVKMKAIQVRDALLSFFGFKVDAGEILSWDASSFEANLIGRFPQWTQTIKAVFSNWSDIVKGFKDVMIALGGVAQAIWTKVAGLFGNFVNDDSVSKFIDKLSKRLTSFAKFLTKNQDGIANFALAIGAIVAALKGFSIISTLIGPVVQFISTCTTALAPFASVIAWAAAIIATIAVLYSSSEAFAASFNNLAATVASSLLQIFEAFAEALQVVWEGTQVLWVENIQPMFAGIGDALAPVIDTLVSLWSNLSAIIVDVFGVIERVWTSTLQPVLALFFDAITKLAEVFESLWVDCLGPVFEYIGNGLEQLWTSTLSPIFEKIIEIVGGIIEIVLLLWNNVLAPVLGWLIDKLGPSISNIFEDLWDAVQSVFSSLGKAFEGLFGMFGGLIDFIAGVFSGDWERVWKGIVNIFVGIGNMLIGIFESVVNFIIGLVNGLISLIWNGIVGLINLILGAVEGIAGLLGFDLNLKLESEPWQIPYLNIPRIPEMATGGVVTSPTLAMIGEGKYDEAVIPLGNSPQMTELVNQIADATKGRGDDTPIQVNVYIGNEQIAEYTHRAEKRRQLQTNGGT